MGEDETVLYELGFYGLAGQPRSSRELVTEAAEGEALGLGTVFISERYNKKEAATLTGAAGAVNDRITIATAATNHNTRHPIVTAGYAATMAKLTGDRFALGVGRGTDAFADVTGTARLTFTLMEDYIGILRRLWRGESVNYSGPVGTIRGLKLGVELPVMPPVIMAAMGEKSAGMGGPLLRRGGVELAVDTASGGTVGQARAPRRGSRWA
jgi:alkanesulfonate monooxygenase SsuD/methylene tetrahydromethanopterin reductase-like flavin-dependent oxidoreductase (luciferase family)